MQLGSYCRSYANFTEHFSLDARRTAIGSLRNNPSARGPHSRAAESSETATCCKRQPLPNYRHLMHPVLPNRRDSGIDNDRSEDTKEPEPYLCETVGPAESE